MDKNTFISSVKEGAIQGMTKSVLASLTIAQAILESGWGESSLTQKANNLFGIKAGASWQGRKISMPTTEYYEDGTPYKIYADFRVYDSLTDSIKDHTELLCKERYTPVRAAKDYKEACIKIRECGYATDPEYGEMLIDIIERYNLNQYDIQNKLCERIDTMNTRELQETLNRLGFKDYEGKTLVVDGVYGRRTESAKAQAKAFINLIMQ